MKLLICAATSMELITYHHHKHQIEYLTTGPGSPSTSFQLGKRFATDLPDLAIQIGIAGTFSSSFVTGDVVQISEDCFADLGAQDKDGSFIPLPKLVSFEGPFGLSSLVPPKKWLIKNLPEAKAITVNKVHGRETDISNIVKLFQPDIETMEGAAFFASCMAFDIACCQLRSISNNVEPRNRESWNIPLALQNLHLKVQEFIDQLD